MSPGHVFHGCSKRPKAMSEAMGSPRFMLMASLFSSFSYCSHLDHVEDRAPPQRRSMDSAVAASSALLRRAGLGIRLSLTLVPDPVEQGCWSLTAACCLAATYCVTERFGWLAFCWSVARGISDSRLSAVHAHSRFRWVVPVGFQDPAQRRAGLLDSAVNLLSSSSDWDIAATLANLPSDWCPPGCCV